jgi:hypothetical protein
MFEADLLRQHYDDNCQQMVEKKTKNSYCLIMHDLCLIRLIL